MNNIAEGFERKTNKEFSQFLYFSKGSSGEVSSMLLLAIELKKISKEDGMRIATLAEEISKILSGIIKSLKE
jgi:four helix bundle protein